MNQEHSDYSEPISVDGSPVHQDGRAPVLSFDNEELLYRRYLSVHFVEGQLLPQTFRFPKQSFNRSKFSNPEDVLHIGCCDGNPLFPSVESWGVLQCRVSAIPTPIDSSNGEGFHFFPKHVPKPTCYAHSELWCRRESSSSGDYDSPPASVREKFRIKLARVLSSRIPAK